MTEIIIHPFHKYDVDLLERRSMNEIVRKGAGGFNIITFPRDQQGSIVDNSL